MRFSIYLWLATVVIMANGCSLGDRGCGPVLGKRAGWLAGRGRPVVVRRVTGQCGCSHCSAATDATAVESTPHFASSDCGCGDSVVLRSPLENTSNGVELAPPRPLLDPNASTRRNVESPPTLPVEESLLSEPPNEPQNEPPSIDGSFEPALQEVQPSGVDRSLGLDFESLLGPNESTVPALPASSSRVLEEPVLDEPPTGAIPTQQLPAANLNFNDKVVLKARPSQQHIVNDNRAYAGRTSVSAQQTSVADIRGIDRYGLPRTPTVEFRELPPLEGQAQPDFQLAPRLESGYSDHQLPTPLRDGQQPSDNSEELKFDPKLETKIRRAIIRQRELELDELETKIRDKTASLNQSLNQSLGQSWKSGTATWSDTLTGVQPLADINTADSRYQVVESTTWGYQQRIAQRLRLPAATPLDRTSTEPPIANIVRVDGQRNSQQLAVIPSREEKRDEETTIER